MEKNNMTLEELSDYVKKCNNNSDVLRYNLLIEEIKFVEMDHDLYLYIDNGIAIIETMENKTILSHRMLDEEDISYLPLLRKSIEDRYKKETNAIEFMLEKQRLRTIFKD